jgi:hypothetical protein
MLKTTILRFPWWLIVAWNVMGPNHHYQRILKYQQNNMPVSWQPAEDRITRRTEIFWRNCTELYVDVTYMTLTLKTKN